MSKSNKKKVIVTKPKKAKTVTPTISKKSGMAASRAAASAPKEMMFERENYIWMIGGIVLILVGLGLMTGGQMSSPDVWDDSVIYSFRRTVLSPFVILLGLGVSGYAIFR